MEQPRSGRFGSGMLDNLKSKIPGFGQKQDDAYDGYADQALDGLEGDPYAEEEAFDSYGSHGEGARSGRASYGSYDDEYYAAGYESYAPVGGDGGYDPLSPALVTSSEARASAPLPSQGSAHGAATGQGAELFDDATCAASASSPDGAAVSRVPGMMGDAQEGRAYVGGYDEFVSPYQARKAHDAEPAGSRTRGSGRSGSRSSGLDSLFSSTEPAPAHADSGQRASGSAAASADVSSDATLRMPSWAGGTPRRDVHLLTPLAYDDVASLAGNVKEDDIVVLSLKSVDSALGKRILDFAFGVASALDARVKCVAPQVFVVNRGGDLTREETQRLTALRIL